MDKKQTQNVGAAAEAALQTVAEQFGLVLNRKNGTFNSTSCTLKFEFAEKGEAGVAMTREAQDFERYAPSFGLATTALGQIFQHRGVRFTITGLKPRAAKFPVLAQSADGRTYKFPASYVATALAMES